MSHITPNQKFVSKFKFRRLFKLINLQHPRLLKYGGISGGRHAKILENWTTIPFQGEDKNTKQKQWQIQNYKNWSNSVDANAIILVNGACLPLQRITPVSFVATLHQNLWHLPQNISQKYIHEKIHVCTNTIDRWATRKKSKRPRPTVRPSNTKNNKLDYTSCLGLVAIVFIGRTFLLVVLFASPLCLSFQHQRDEI